MDLWIFYTLILIGIYISILVLLRFMGAFKAGKVSLWGPFLLWRTQKGKKLIERLAVYKRFWNFYGRVSIGICFFMMFLLMFFLIWAATVVPSIPEEDAPPPQLLIGIPGVNPIIPIWYGIIALAIAVAVHEIAHGILTRVGDLKVKSLGIVACIIPIGAFVEPDEEELKAAEKKKRMRIFAAGPSTNIVFAIICALIFSWSFMGSVVPAAEGVFVNQVVVDSPAFNASLEPGMIITHINGTSYNGTPIDGVDIQKRSDFHDFMKTPHMPTILST
jgi:membrane-associated protease RseP (regulator of RpoE activity)